jgi:alpha-tubulin suppressor-like RCC1 family protein
MATSKTLREFTASTTPPADTDFIVGYSQPVYGGERRWTLAQIKTAVGSDQGGDDNKADPLIPDVENGFIKFLAKHAPSSYACAAVTSTNRVIVWGRANGYNGGAGGQLAPSFVSSSQIEPMQYARVPFYSNWDRNAGADGVDYLDENPNVQIVDLYWTVRVGFALLSDGTAWVTGYNEGDIGLGTAPTTGNGYKPTCGFVKLNFSGASIKKIQCGSDNNDTSRTSLFAALDTTDTLWMWGETKDAVFGKGTAVQILNTPSKITSQTIVLDKTGSTGAFNFEGQVLDFSINSVDTNTTAIGIVTKNGQLFFGGDNSQRQRGAGGANATTTMLYWNRAYKYTIAGGESLVVDAVTVSRSVFGGAFNHYYVDTGGSVWACGQNSFGQLGNGTTTNPTASPPKGFFTLVQIPAGYKAVTTKPAVFHNSYWHPVLYALCVDTTTNKNVLFSWGCNRSVGYCGVDSTASLITVPTICKFRNSSGVKVPLTNLKDVYISDNFGSDGDSQSYGSVWVVDNDGYAYTAGYRNYNEPPLYDAHSRQYFIRLPFKNIKDIVLSGNVTGHQWSIFLVKNGAVYGIGNVAYKLFGSADVAKHPIRLL